MSDVTAEYLATLWAGVHDEAVDDVYAADVMAHDVPKLIREIWRLRGEAARLEGFKQGLLEGVEWLKRDNVQMLEMLAAM